MDSDSEVNLEEAEAAKGIAHHMLISYLSACTSLSLVVLLGALNSMRPLSISRHLIFKLPILRSKETTID
jgi:hypothetical protein